MVTGACAQMVSDSKCHIAAQLLRPRAAAATAVQQLSVDLHTNGMAAHRLTIFLSLALLAAGYMPCPYNANNNGYTWCQCPGLGPPFGLCVADSYYCGYYCQYAPSWIFTAIAKGAMLCPIDPAQIDPYKPDIVFPGWVSSWAGTLSTVAHPAQLQAQPGQRVHSDSLRGCRARTNLST